MFKNGVRGSGPLGIPTNNYFDVGAENEKYSPIWKVHSVKWNNEDSS